MKLKKWALIAEIVGAVAIVVSLIFVGLQVRDSTTATYAGTYDDLLADMVYWRMELATSPDALRGFYAYINPDSGENWDPMTMFAGHVALEAVVQVFERAYFARRYGRLNDQEWSRFQRAMCSPEYHEMWARANVDPFVFSQEFWQYVSECSPE